MASLIVHKTYVGADTFGNPIEPGTYAVDHAHLYGLAAYLVDIGYAEYAESVAVEVEPEPAPEPEVESVEPDAIPEPEAAPVPTPRKRKGG